MTVLEVFENYLLISKITLQTLDQYWSTLVLIERLQAPPPSAMGKIYWEALLNLNKNWDWVLKCFSISKIISSLDFLSENKENPRKSREIEENQGKPQFTLIFRLKIGEHCVLRLKSEGRCPRSTKPSMPSRLKSSLTQS